MAAAVKSNARDPTHTRQKETRERIQGPPSSLFLMLCGDIESNPGPSTDELIMELGRSLGTRPVSYTHLTLPTTAEV